MVGRLRPHIDLVPESAAELIEPYTNGASRVLIGTSTSYVPILHIADSVVNAWRPSMSFPFIALLVPTNSQSGERC
jgi:hypothetical protein